MNDIQEKTLERYPWLEGLNPPQQEAVLTTKGPVLLLSGAGTGKTKALTSRFAHLLLTNKAFPREVLAVTFTNKAAREMRERIESLLGQPADGWWLGTFHALALRMLRRHPEAIGLKSGFTVLDDDDQQRLLRQLMPELGLDPKRARPREAGQLIQRWKDRALEPEAVQEEAAGLVFAQGKLGTLYSLYQSRLAQLNTVDFGDLLMLCLRLFREQAEVLETWQSRFRYILVDEYQDTNVAQYLWLRLLAQGHRNLCCVGDDDQSIYAWRGAVVGNILRFEEDFPGAKVIRLEQNYRSTKPILEAASGLIAHNRSRLGKTLWTDLDEGEKVKLRSYYDGENEAEEIAHRIQNLHDSGVCRFGEVAVLVRAGYLIRTLEERFLSLGLPYRVVGGPRFYERLEIRDALAYLRLIWSSADDLAFERIVNQPKRGIGPTTISRLRQAATPGGLSLLEASGSSDALAGLTRAAAGKLAAFAEAVAGWRKKLESTPHPELAELVLEESGYLAYWKNQPGPEAEGRVENLGELVNAMAEFESLELFLEHVSLVLDSFADKNEDKVSLMTLHAAKGLEFRQVFLPAWEAGIFPSQRAVDNEGVEGLEEERRLAYVGITRARQGCHISFAERRLMHGQYANSWPSRFVQEIPEAALEREGALAFRSVGQPSYLTGGSQISDTEGRVPPGVREGRPGDLFRARMLARRAELGQSMGSDPQTGGFSATPKIKRSEQRFQKGEKVWHLQFGEGRVVEVDGNRLAVDFDAKGPKLVMASFMRKVGE